MLTIPSSLKIVFIYIYVYCDLLNGEVHSTHAAGYLLSPFKIKKIVFEYSFLKYCSFNTSISLKINYNT